MTIIEALSFGNAVLHNPLETEMLLAYILAMRREYVIAHPDQSIAQKHVVLFEQYITQRKSGHPLAYLTHHREFFGLDFYVDERVMIPRPETELLVETAMKTLRHAYGKVEPEAVHSVRCPLIVDVGTGSGCIAIALAKYLPNLRVIATDISEGALEVAVKNAERHNVSDRIKFVKSNLLDFVIARAMKNRPKQSHKRSHITGIVANLPYVATTETASCSQEVLEYEPPNALFSGEDGFDHYRKFFEQLAQMRQKPAWVIGEIGFQQKQGITLLIERHFPDALFEWRKDLADTDRAFILYPSFICGKN